MGGGGGLPHQLGQVQDVQDLIYGRGVRRIPLHPVLVGIFAFLGGLGRNGFGEAFRHLARSAPVGVDQRGVGPGFKQLPYSEKSTITSLMVTENM